MSKLRESWREKLEKTGERNDLPRVIEIDEKMSQKWGSGTCAIPSPLEVDAIMRSVPEGKLITINQIRGMVAARHGASFG